jgi:hypothetical protein
MGEGSRHRADSAGFWALILGSVSFLFQGKNLLPGVYYNWNDMALVSAVLAVIYGFIISRGGINSTMGFAGGTLGAVMLFDMFLFRDFQSLIRDFNDVLPDKFSAEAVITFGLILISIYFVVFKPQKNKEQTKKE